MGTLSRMTLREILAQYSPAYPLDEALDREARWDIAFDICRAHDSQTLADLTTDFQNSGFFREPILLDEPEYAGEKYVKNGMHRLTVLRDLELWDTPVLISYDDYVFKEGEEVVIVHFTMTYDKSTFLDIEDKLFDVSSFPVNEHLWFDFDGLALEHDDDVVRVSLESVIRLVDVVYMDDIRHAVYQKFSVFEGFVGMDFEEKCVLL